MLANVIGQLFLISKFLGFDFHSYGFYVVESMIQGLDWTESPKFPRVTMCDFDIRRLGNVHRYTVQCLLMINLYNEKIYLIIWLWFVLVAALSIIGILLLIFRMAISSDRETYVMKHLVCDDVYNPDSERDQKFLYKFVNEYLRLDGVLMLRLVGHNTNKVVVNEFTSALFDMFKRMITEEKTPTAPEEEEGEEADEYTKPMAEDTV